MLRSMSMMAMAATVALAASAGMAQEAKAPAQKPTPAATKSAAAKNTPSGPKAGPGEKVCRHKFPSGEKRAWVCKKEEPCCAWDEINYVKCGSTITNCL